MFVDFLAVIMDVLKNQVHFEQKPLLVELSFFIDYEFSEHIGFQNVDRVIIRIKESGY